MEHESFRAGVHRAVPVTRLRGVNVGVVRPVVACLIGEARAAADGDGRRVLFDANRRPMDLHGKANGAIIETCFDHDKGTLSFGINGGPLQRALDGFPVGAAMRPHAFLPGSGHRVSFTCPYVQHALPAGRLTDMVLP